MQKFKKYCIQPLHLTKEKHPCAESVASQEKGTKKGNVAVKQVHFNVQDLARTTKNACFRSHPYHTLQHNEALKPIH